MRIDKDNIKIILILLVVCLSLGYAYINSDLNINGTAQVKHANWDIHWANIQVTTGSVTGSNVVTTPTISNGTTVNYSITLPTPGSFYEFTVDAVNSGQMDAMIDTIDSKLNNNPITNLPVYLKYSVTYFDGVPLEPNHLLATNTTEKYKVKLEYRTDITESQLPTTNQSLALSFTVTYRQATDDAITVPHPVSFSNDPWTTIMAVVQSGNTSNYNVGDTKTVDMGSLGTHTLRIANKSTPAECSTTGFSQTACGFVLEFADIITDHVMNSTATNTGGWPATSMRIYVNNDIYAALPLELKNGIIDTTVISGHGSTRGETNFTSIDKIYILNAKEVGHNPGYDSEKNSTRILDYYNENNQNSRRVKYKSSGSVGTWWLRSLNMYAGDTFNAINYSGNYGVSTANNEVGVSPAFRIG